MPTETSSIFFLDVILEEIVVNTNYCIGIMSKAYTRINTRDTYLLEIKALIGILYMTCVMKSSVLEELPRAPDRTAPKFIV